MLRANFFTYTHIGTYRNSAVFPSLSYDVTRKSGLTTNTNIGAGYLRTSLKGDVYEVDDNSKVISVKNAGHSRFVVIVSTEFGYDFGKLAELPVAFYFSPAVYFVLPEAKGTETHLALETGLKFFIPPRKNK